MTCEIWRPSQDSHEMKTEIWCEIFGRANVELLERDKVREREGTRRGRRISSPPRVHRPLRIPIGHVRHSRRGQSMWRKNGKGLIAYKREKETHTERSKANTWKWDRSDSDLVTLNQWLTRPRTCVMLQTTCNRETTKYCLVEIFHHSGLSAVRRKIAACQSWNLGKTVYRDSVEWCPNLCVHQSCRKTARVKMVACRE